MANIIGVLRKNATYGEEQFLEALRKLPPEFMGWVELPVGNSSCDFVLLHPQKGLFFLEVKDYKTILFSDVERVKVKRKDGSVYSDRNPLRELREKSERKADELGKRWELCENGQLIVPWTYAVAFPNLATKDLQVHSALCSYTDDRPCVIGRDDFQNPDRLCDLLAKMAFVRKGFRGLSERQIKAIQAALRKETVVVDEGEELGIADSVQQEAALHGIYDELRTETSPEGDEAARSYRLRLVRGVAGSGKTFVLGLRAYYLHQLNPEWDILVLTRNQLLANSLRRRLKPLQPKVQVRHWHDFARNLLRQVKVRIEVEGIECRHSEMKEIVKDALDSLGHPAQLSNLTLDFLAREIEWIKDTVPLNPKTMKIERADYLKADRSGRVQRLTQSQRKVVFELFQRYESLKDLQRLCDYHDHALLLQKAILWGKLSTRRFDAILIDEAQDFAPAWFVVIKQMLRGDSVFMTADPAQRVFGSFSWRELGFEVVGRSRTLKRPYRNTYEIFTTAHEFARRNSVLIKQLEREGEVLLEPEVVPDEMRHGPWPTVTRYSSLSAELDHVLREVCNLQKQRDSRTGQERYRLHDITVLLPTKNAVNKARNFFESRGFSTNTPEVSEEDTESTPFVKDRLNVTTLQKVRGLEFKVVFLCQLQALPPTSRSAEDPEQEEENLIERSRWLYVGMTRAREILHMSYQSSPPPELQSLMQVLDAQRSKHSK